MELATISRTQLVGNSYNPRKRFDTAKMKELETSLKEIGFMQPLLVRPIERDKYEVIAGMRRYMASKTFNEIPCYIREMTDDEAKLCSIVENLERADLTPMEEARAYATYLNFIVGADLHQERQDGMKAKINEFAKSLPISAETVRNRLSLLDLDEDVQTMLDNEILFISEAETIVSLKKLVNIRKKALSGDISNKIVKEKVINEFWPEIHKQMESIAKSIVKGSEHRFERTMNLPRLKDRIKNVLMAAELEATAKSDHQADLQEKFDKAKTDLIEFLTNMQEDESFKIEFDFDEETLRKDVKDLQKKCEKDLSEVSDVREIMDKKREYEDELDRMTLARKYVTTKIKDYCPYCGAGIEIDNLNKRIQEHMEMIGELNKQENAIAREKKLLNNVSKKLENFISEYDHRLAMLEEEA